MPVEERVFGYVKEVVIVVVFAVAIVVVLAAALAVSLAMNDYDDGSSSSSTPAYAGMYVSLSLDYSSDLCLPSPTSGTVPTWLSGTWLRVTAGSWALWDGLGSTSDTQEDAHWFHYVPMIQGFTFVNGSVGCSSKYLNSTAYILSVAGRPSEAIFANYSVMSPGDDFNCQINIQRIGGDDVFLSVAETTNNNHFDPDTLETLSPSYSWNNDELYNAPAVSLAHGHFDPDDGTYYNLAIYPKGLDSNDNPRLRLFKVATNDTQRQVFQPNITGYFDGDMPWQHSFALTKNYAVLVYAPIFYPNPLSAQIREYLWGPDAYPELEPADGWQSEFRVVSLATGEEVMRFTSEPFLTMHHANAYEDEDTNMIVVDMVAYPSDVAGDVLNVFYLHTILEDPTSFVSIAGQSGLYRYQLPLSSPSSTVTGTKITPLSLEFPVINYEKYNGRRYRYLYATAALGADSQGDDALAKIDVGMQTYSVWRPDGTAVLFPSEPLFVASPTAHSEDDGVVLSLVFDSRNSTNFLLVLDGITFTELARVYTPYTPYGLHGHFYSDIFPAKACYA